MHHGYPVVFKRACKFPSAMSRFANGEFSIAMLREGTPRDTLLTQDDKGIARILVVNQPPQSTLPKSRLCAFLFRMMGIAQKIRA